MATPASQQPQVNLRSSLYSKRRLVCRWSGQEPVERRGQVLGSLFGEVVAGVDAVTGDVVGPVAPDHHGVAVELFKVVAGGPQDEQGCVARVGRPRGLLVRAASMPRPAR